MFSTRRAARSLILVAVVTATISCAQPPDREMQLAEGAIETARAAGADRYASVEFVAAVDALERSRTAVTQRDYRLALNHALDSRERAQTAAKEATDARAAAQTGADRALNMATAALEQAQASLKAAEGARLTPRVIDPAADTIDQLDRQVQEARTAFGKGEYGEATKGASAATEALAALTRDLDAAMRPATRRRR